MWSYVLSSGETADASVVQARVQHDEIHQIHGLRLGSPLEVTQTSRVAGAVEQAISAAGDDVTVTRQ
jgi:hypothetical protein